MSEPTKRKPRKRASQRRAGEADSAQELPVEGAPAPAEPSSAYSGRTSRLYLAVEAMLKRVLKRIRWVSKRASVV